MIKNIALLISSAFISCASFSQVVVYSEDFQNGLPATYVLTDNDGFTPHADVIEFADAWIILADPADNTDSIVGSTSYFTTAGLADRWLITPPITLGAYGNILYWEAKSHDASFPDSYQVLISTTGTEIADFTDTVSSIGQELATWYQREVNLSDYAFDNQTIHIAFVNRTYDRFKLYVDDIRVEKEDPLNVNSITKNVYSIYPNPTTGSVTIKANVSSYTVLSLAGRELIKGNSNTIDLDSLESGRYIVRFTTDGLIHSATIIKQ